MPVEAQNYDPRLGFMARIYTNGILADTVEKITLPTEDPQNVTTSAGGVPFDRHHTGGIVYGDLVVERFMIADETDTWATDWKKLQVNTRNRTIGKRVDYKRTVTIEMLDGSGSVIQTYRYLGCHILTIDIGQLDFSDKAGKVIQTITIKVEERDDSIF